MLTKKGYEIVNNEIMGYVFFTGLAVAVLCFIGVQSAGCDGVFVRTLFWFECIKG